MLNCFRCYAKIIKIQLFSTKTYNFYGDRILQNMQALFRTLLYAIALDMYINERVGTGMAAMK